MHLFFGLEEVFFNIEAIHLLTKSVAKFIEQLQSEQCVHNPVIAVNI
jgi:hypothetical protein